MILSFSSRDAAGSPPIVDVRCRRCLKWMSWDDESRFESRFAPTLERVTAVLGREVGEDPSTGSGGGRAAPQRGPDKRENRSVGTKLVVGVTTPPPLPRHLVYEFRSDAVHNMFIRTT